MAESQTVVILRAKRDAIAATIQNYEREIERAKADFTHITAALAIFDAGDQPGSQRPYVGLHKAFKYGELAAMCRAALADGPLSTPDIARRIMAEKGLDAADRVMARSVGFSVLQSMRGMARRRMVVKLPRSRGRCVWTLAVNDLGALARPTYGYQMRKLLK